MGDKFERVWGALVLTMFGLYLAVEMNGGPIYLVACWCFYIIILSLDIRFEKPKKKVVNKKK